MVFHNFALIFPGTYGTITCRIRKRFATFSHISVSRRGIARGPIDTALNALGLDRRVAVIAPSFHAAMFALPDSDLILPVPKEALYSANRLKLPLRAFTLPISLPTLVLTQAWHPRFDKDPAHKWLREQLLASV